MSEDSYDLVRNRRTIIVSLGDEYVICIDLGDHNMLLIVDLLSCW